MKLHFDRIRHAKMPSRARIVITSVYVLLGLSLLGGMYIIGNKIQTRSLPVGSVTVSTPYTRYVVGDTISFTVANNYNSGIYFTNTCPDEPLEIYKQINGAWERIHDVASAKDCHDENRQVLLPAGKSMTVSFAPWKHLFAEPGKYRIVAYVDFYNALPYTDFEVIAAPTVPALITQPPVVAASPAKPSTTTSKSSTSNTSTQTNQTTNNTTTPSTPSGSTLKDKTITLSVGTVVVKYSSTTVYVQSISPASGYTYEGGKSGSLVEITFKKGGSETQLQLFVRNGSLIQRVE